MKEWRTYKIEDICKRVCSGGTPKSTEQSYYNGDIPWLNTKEINFNRISSTEKSITQYGLDNSSAKWIDKDSVIVAMYGATAAKVAINTIPLTTNQACCNLSINENIADYRFVYFWLCANYTTLASLANGGAQQNLNAQQIKDFEIKLPDLVTQQKIADILWSIDDKINCNYAINDNLEQQAQALYKQWFVDFEFPNKDGKPYKSSGGKMVDSELGQIPEGWRVQTFGDLIKPQKGKNITRAQVTIGSIPVVAGGLMPSCYHNTSNTHCPVVTISASGANAGYVKMYHMPIWAADCSYIDDTISKYVHFAYVFLTYNQTSIYHKQQGCAQPHIYPSHLMELQFICPTLDILDKFESWSKKIYKLIGTNIQEIETLAILRDTLLPKLMSGELNVDDVSVD